MIICLIIYHVISYLTIYHLIIYHLMIIICLTIYHIISYLVANMGGRLGWASFSDKIGERERDHLIISWSTISSHHVGRKNTYHIFFGFGIPLYLSIPFSGLIIWSIKYVSSINHLTISQSTISSQFTISFDLNSYDDHSISRRGEMIKYMSQNLSSHISYL